MNFRKSGILILCVLIVYMQQSCKNNPSEDQPALFVFKGNTYYLPYNETLPKDSNSLKKFMEEKATEQIFYELAKEKLGKDPELEEQIEKYRQQLYIYELEKKIIENNLDTLIPDKEIQFYYNQHYREFVLPQTIIKILYVRVPIQNRSLKRIQDLIRNFKPDKETELQNLFIQNASAYSVDMNKWLILDETRKNISFLTNISPDYLTIEKTFEFTENNEWVYLKILDRKNQNSLSPIGFVKKQIREKILRERAQNLILQYKKQLLEEALQDGTLKWNP